MGKQNDFRQVHYKKRGKTTKIRPNCPSGYLKNAEREIQAEMASTGKMIGRKLRKELERYPLLFRAVYLGCESAVDIIMEVEGNVNDQISDGSTPLIIAVEKGYFGIAQKLLKKGANPHLLRKDGRNALMIAVSKNDTRCFSLIWNYWGKNIWELNHRDVRGYAALAIGAESGCLAACEFLLSLTGVEVDKQADDGRTPLMLAALKGNAPLVRVLLLAGADHSLEDKVGASALCLAVSRGRSQVIRLIVECLDDRSRDAYVKSRVDLLVKPKRENTSETLSFYKGVLFKTLLEIRRRMEDGVVLLEKHRIFPALLKCLQTYQQDLELLRCGFHLCACLLHNGDQEVDLLAEQYVRSGGSDFALRVMCGCRLVGARAAAFLSLQAGSKCESGRAWLGENRNRVQPFLRGFRSVLPRLPFWAEEEGAGAKVAFGMFEEALQGMESPAAETKEEKIQEISEWTGFGGDAKQNQTRKGSTAANTGECENRVPLPSGDLTFCQTGYADALKKNLEERTSPTRTEVTQKAYKPTRTSNSGSRDNSDLDDFAVDEKRKTSHGQWTNVPRSGDPSHKTQKLERRPPARRSFIESVSSKESDLVSTRDESSASTQIVPHHSLEESKGSWLGRKERTIRDGPMEKRIFQNGSSSSDGSDSTKSSSVDLNDSYLTGFGALFSEERGTFAHRNFVGESGVERDFSPEACDSSDDANSGSKKTTEDNGEECESTAEGERNIPPVPDSEPTQGMVHQAKRRFADLDEGDSNSCERENISTPSFYELLPLNNTKYAHRIRKITSQFCDWKKTCVPVVGTKPPTMLPFERIDKAPKSNLFERFESTGTENKCKDQMRLGAKEIFVFARYSPLDNEKRARRFQKYLTTCCKSVMRDVRKGKCFATTEEAREVIAERNPSPRLASLRVAESPAFGSRITLIKRKTADDSRRQRGSKVKSRTSRLLLHSKMNDIQEVPNLRQGTRCRGATAEDEK